MGASVSTFGEQSGDAAQNLVRNTYMGAQTAGSRLGQGLGGMQQSIGGTGNAIKTEIKGQGGGQQG